MGKRVINYDVRLELERLIKRGYTIRKIGLQLGICEDTLISEMKRYGRDKGRKYSYNAEEAQKLSELKLMNQKRKGREAAQFIRKGMESDKILQENELLKMQIEILEKQLKEFNK